MKLISVILFMALQACQTITPFHGPDGKTHYLVTCNGLDKTIANCYNEAYESCGGPYCVTSREEFATFVIDEKGHGYPLVFRSMEFDCGECSCGQDGHICIITE